MSTKIELCVDVTSPPCTFAAFVKRMPAYSIALDGYVSEGPQYSDETDGPYINFNHHEGVSRLETRATCAQVLMSIRQGLFTKFRRNGAVTANVFVNDCDEDVCLSWFLLKHHYLAEHTNPILNRLVAMEDALDTTAGAYPYPVDLPALQEIAWIFEPYRRVRTSGDVQKRQQETFESVIYDVEQRIMQHLVGRGDSIALDSRFLKIGGGKNWTMVRELGAHARTGMFAEGIRAFVSVREKDPIQVPYYQNPGITFADEAFQRTGRYPPGITHWIYTIGRMSPFIDFPVAKILKELNDCEGTTDDRWGGGDSFGGSPRIHGSRLSPEVVGKVINSLVK